MILDHFDSHPIHHFNHDHFYDVTKQQGCYKPEGFWVSVRGEDDWPSWCLSENFWADGLSCRHRVTLVDDAAICLITNGSQLEAFHEQWAEERDFDRKYRESYGHNRMGLSDEYLRLQWEINWSKVATEYDGVIITPYLWSHRTGGPSWYYPWDCASGVIWNGHAIKGVELDPMKQLVC